MKKLILILTIFLIVGCQSTTEFNEPVDPSTLQDNTVNETVEEPEEPEEPSAREVLRDYLEMRPTFKATYEVNSNVRGESNSGVETVVIKGDNSKRSFEDESFYVLGEEVFLCQSGECWTIPQDEPPQEVDVSIPENATVTFAGERQVAGLQAECFSIKSEETVLDCRSESGILLYFTRSIEDYELEMEATSVEQTVSDSEFKLPSTPKKYDPEDFQNAQPR